VPNPGGGSLYLRLNYDNQQLRWNTLALTTGGTFRWSEYAPPGRATLEATAWFEGNRKYGAARYTSVGSRPATTDTLTTLLRRRPMRPLG
jgi:hypothetical protein